MSSQDLKREQIEQDWRSFAALNGWDKPNAHRDRYAKFMAEKLPDADESCAKKWLERFRSGRHWHAMDTASKVAYIKTLTRSTGGTGKEVSVEVLRQALTEVTKDG
jgi:hypothetical protein